MRFQLLKRGNKALDSIYQRCDWISRLSKFLKNHFSHWMGMVEADC
jgi:hypothetical protein